MRIRTAALPGDADDLASVYLASASHHMNLDPLRYRVPDRIGVVEHYVALRLAEGEHAILAAEDGDRLVGFIEIRKLQPPAPWGMMLHGHRAQLDIAVLDESRGQGVGHALIAAAEAWATKHGVGALILDALSTNVRALSFYEECGYRQFGTLMEKAIAR